jgi:hypothetical protein
MSLVDTLSLLENSIGVADVLNREFSNFPRSIISYLKSSASFAPGSSLAPEWREAKGISFLENYLCISDQPRDAGSDDEFPGYHLGSKMIRSMPLAVWTGGRVGTPERGVPIEVVIGHWERPDIERFASHYQGQDTRRSQRLLECHEWIYHDLFSTFMDWNGIWDCVRCRLEDLDHEVHDQLGTSNILGRMRNLNKAVATNIMLREALAVQKNSLDTFMEFVTQNKDSFRSVSNVEFLKRGKELLKALEHYKALANGNQEQLQNLVSMMVAMEQISQGQSVGRLNLLAFTFLPLSFIAVSISMYSQSAMETYNII